MYFTQFLSCQENLASLEKLLGITIENTVNTTDFENILCFVELDSSDCLINSLDFPLLISYTRFEIPLFLSSSLTFLIIKIHHCPQGPVQMP